MNSANPNILYIFLAGTAIFLLLALIIIVFVVVYQRRIMEQRLQMRIQEQEAQKKLLNAVVQTQEKERQRIARDLHDEVGATLSAVKTHVNLVGRRLKKGGMADPGLGDTRQIIDEAIQNVRRISHDLLPPALENLGLGPALNEFAKKVSAAASIRFQPQVAELPHPLPRDFQLGIFRIVQELVGNTLKHARASEISLKIQAIEPHILLEYQDNGRGFNPNQVEKSGTGLGLQNLQSRATLLQGKLQLVSAPGEGTRVRIEFPLPIHNPLSLSS